MRRVLDSSALEVVESEWFLGAFANLRKATLSFVMPVCPSVGMEQLGCQWTNFHEICYLRIFRKSVEKIKVSLTFWRWNYFF